MTMLTQMAVSLAFELGLHKPPVNGAQRCKFGRSVAEQQQARRERTLEERRTILALFHLSSSYVFVRLFDCPHSDILISELGSHSARRSQCDGLLICKNAYRFSLRKESRISMPYLWPRSSVSLSFTRLNHLPQRSHFWRERRGQHLRLLSQHC